MFLFSALWIWVGRWTARGFVASSQLSLRWSSRPWRALPKATSLSAGRTQPSCNCGDEPLFRNLRLPVAVNKPFSSNPRIVGPAVHLMLRAPQRGIHLCKIPLPKPPFLGSWNCRDEPLVQNLCLGDAEKSGRNKKNEHEHKHFGRHFLWTFLTPTPFARTPKRLFPITAAAGKHAFWCGYLRSSARTSMTLCLAPC